MFGKKKNVSFRPNIQLYLDGAESLFKAINRRLKDIETVIARNAIQDACKHEETEKVCLICKKTIKTQKKS